MNQWGAVAYYRINRDYIAENLCVNRDKPMLNCNGQCYLAKKLKAAEEKEAFRKNARSCIKLSSDSTGLYSAFHLFGTS
ncbi:MAG: hypothetical protein RLZ73_1011 [Bacteroidota bacterium]